MPSCPIIVNTCCNNQLLVAVTNLHLFPPAEKSIAHGLPARPVRFLTLSSLEAASQWKDHWKRGSHESLGSVKETGQGGQEGNGTQDRL